MKPKVMLEDGMMLEIVLRGDNLEEEAEELTKQIEKILGRKFFRAFYHAVKIIN